MNLKMKEEGILDFRLYMKRKFGQFSIKQKANSDELFTQVHFYYHFLS